MLRNSRYLSSILGIKPNQIIHVGADKGQDRPEYIKIGCKKIVWCEADPNNVAYLENNFSQDTVIGGLIWNEDSVKLDFYQFKNSAQNSAITPLANIAAEARKIISVPSHKLDTVIESDGISDPCLLVIDVQGAELEVLAGARKVLTRTQFVVIEIALHSQGYSETPTQQSITNSLEILGFKSSIYRVSHDSSYKDQLFVKSNRLRLVQISLIDSTFNFIMKIRHGIKFGHIPKYHYHCRHCDS
jgi:FkbM family methyltransferase